MLYIAQYPVLWTAHRALHVTSGRSVHSDTNSTSLGSHAAYCLKTIHSHFHHRLKTYLFIQLSELRHCGENENAQTLKKWQRDDSNPGYLDCHAFHV